MEARVRNTVFPCMGFVVLLLLSVPGTLGLKQREWLDGNVLFSGTRPKPRDANYDLVQIARKIYIFGGQELISGRALPGEGT